MAPKQPQPDPIYPDADAKYLAINVLARRAKDLARTSKPTIAYGEGTFDPLEVAKEEIGRGLLAVRRRNEITNELEKFD